jgi:hypothetical protein
LLDDSRTADDTWTRLAKQLDACQLVDLVFIVGTYTCLAMVFNSFVLKLEAGIDTSGMPLPPE